MLKQKDVLQYLISKGPGRTEKQLAEAIHGIGAVQPTVNQDCRMLADEGKVERYGHGGAADPFRYRPKSEFTVLYADAGDKMS